MLRVLFHFDVLEVGKPRAPKKHRRHRQSIRKKEDPRHKNSKSDAWQSVLEVKTQDRGEEPKSMTVGSREGPLQRLKKRRQLTLNREKYGFGMN